MATMHRCAVLALLVAVSFLPAAAFALDKVDPYICPTQTQGSGIDCFLQAVPQTYTMCRHIKSIEIIEFKLAAAPECVHGAKTAYCIDKHNILIDRPYQASRPEPAR